MPTTYRPLRSLVICRRATPEAVTAGGLVIPDVAQDIPFCATVVAVGPGKELKDGTAAPMTVKPGDTVLCDKHAGVEFVLDGDDRHFVVREDVLLGVLEA